MPIDPNIVQEAALAGAHQTLSGVAQHPSFMVGVFWIVFTAALTAATLYGIGWVRDQVTALGSGVRDLRGMKWQSDVASLEIPWKGAAQATLGDDKFFLTNLKQTVYGRVQGDLVCDSLHRVVGVMSVSLKDNKTVNLSTLFVDGRSQEHVSAIALTLVL